MAEARDNRRVARFPAKDRAFALLKPFCDKLGQIKDIGLGGLSFEYLDVGAETETAKPDQLTIDIIMTRESFYLSQIPCVIVYDQPVSQDSSHFLKGVETRRCGLRFSNLTEDQEGSLETFLTKHVHSP